MAGRKERTVVCLLLLAGALILGGCGAPSSDFAGDAEEREQTASDREAGTEEGQTVSDQVEEQEEGQPTSDWTEEAEEKQPTADQTGKLKEGQPTSGQAEELKKNQPAAGRSGESEQEDSGLVYEGSMELQYAENFSVDYYEGGYRLLTVTDGTKLLVIPEGKAIPEGLAEEIKIIRSPAKNLYLVASGTMDMFAALDAVDTIRLSGQREENWYIESAKEAMKRGDMIYAGKYNKPDYELIVSENCTLAIENRMITHSPEVAEMLEDFGIPVMVEYSSYEKHPLGRVEWIRFFGALVGKEEEAEKAFEEQLTIADRIAADENTGKTVAFFYITSNGLVQVRQSSDYVPKMIGLAGGRYIFDDLGDPESGRSTLNMQIEEFYAGAKDADYIIYNSSIDGGVLSVEELIGKCDVLKDFKAVREGNVWCTTNDMYQQSMSVGYLMEDMHAMLHGEDDGEMRYLYHLK